MRPSPVHPLISLLASNPARFFAQNWVFELTQLTDEISIKPIKNIAGSDCLGECHCHPQVMRNNPDNFRTAIEKYFCDSLSTLKTNPVLLDIGSGGLFQSLVLIAIMITQGFCQSTIVLADPLFQTHPNEMQKKMDALCGILKTAGIAYTINDTNNQKTNINIYTYATLQEIPLDLQRKLTHITAIDFYPAIPMQQLLLPLQSALNLDCMIMSAMPGKITQENVKDSFPSEAIFLKSYTEEKKPAYAYAELKKRWNAVVAQIDTDTDHATFLKNFENAIEEARSKKRKGIDQNSATFFLDILYRLHAVSFELIGTDVKKIFPPQDTTSLTTPRRGLSEKSQSALNTTPPKKTPPKSLVATPPPATTTPVKFANKSRFLGCATPTSTPHTSPSKLKKEGENTPSSTL